MLGVRVGAQFDQVPAEFGDADVAARRDAAARVRKHRPCPGPLDLRRLSTVDFLDVAQYARHQFLVGRLVVRLFQCLDQVVGENAGPEPGDALVKSGAGRSLAGGAASDHRELPPAARQRPRPTPFRGRPPLGQLPPGEHVHAVGLWLLKADCPGAAFGFRIAQIDYPVLERPRSAPLFERQVAGSRAGMTCVEDYRDVRGLDAR